MAANPPLLPEHHLALVVEDALAAVDAAPGHSSAPRPAPDLRAVLLYGWAGGLLSAGDVVRREEVDAGLRYLLRGTQLRAEELRAFREQHAAALEAVYGQVFDLCLATGMTSLGTIWLGD